MKPLLTRSILLACAALSSQASAQVPGSLRPLGSARIGPTLPPPTSSAQGNCAAQELLVSTNSGAIYRIDNYATAPAATLVTDTGLNGIADIAIEPGTGDLFGVVFLGTTVGMDLVRIDLASGNNTLIGTLPEFTNALDFASDGRLFGRGGSGTTYEIDPVTGTSTIVGTAGAGSAGDLAWEVGGTVLVTTNNGDIERTDVATGTSTILFNTGLGPFVYGIEVDCDGTTYVATDTGDWATVDLQTGLVTIFGNLGLFEPVFGIAFSEGPGVPTLGTTYCSPGIANSSGVPGVMSGLGSSLVAQNNVELIGGSLPLNSFGFFLTSQTQGLTMNPGGSQGNLCLGGSIGRYVGAGQIQNSGGAGEIRLSLDLGSTPTPTGLVSVQAGETWNFQAWHRDAVGGSATSNFTDAISIAFQ